MQPLGAMPNARTNKFTDIYNTSSASALTQEGALIHSGYSDTPGDQTKHTITTSCSA